MRIWWYLASQFLKSILSILSFSLGLYFLLTYMEDSQHYFDKYNPKGILIFLYYFWQFPSIATQFLPFAVLVGGIITNWILAKHGEIAALRAAGVSMLRIGTPLIIVGLFFTIAQFCINEFLIPVTMPQFLHLQKEKIEGKRIENFFTESAWLKAKDTVLHFNKYDSVKRELFGVEYYQLMSPHTVQRIVHANSAYFNENLNKWILRDAAVTEFSEPEQNSFESLISGHKPLYLTNISYAPPKVLKQSSDSNQLSYWQLNRIINEAQLAGTNVSDRIVDLYMKVSTPFASLLFVFLTMPFALRKERQEETYIGIVICLAAALAYWFGNMALRSLAVKDELNPLIAAWAMNILVAILSFLLIKKLDKGR